MHIAIIMDGNGRWASARNLSRASGHRAGARLVPRIVRAALGRGVRALTLFAFSADNWQRPLPEVQGVLGHVQRFLFTQTDRCAVDGVRISVIGRRERLALPLRRQIEVSEARTAGGERLHLRLAVDYSSRRSLLTAACRESETIADVDLLIRTGGEQRLSDFLLWECAYAELLFLSCCWPDFDEAQFAAALAEFQQRVRRYGRLDSALTDPVRSSPDAAAGVVPAPASDTCAPRR